MKRSRLRERREVLVAVLRLRDDCGIFGSLIRLLMDGKIILAQAKLLKNKTKVIGVCTLIGH